MVLVASDSSFFNSTRSSSSNIEDLFHMPGGDTLQLSLPASSTTTASCSHTAFAELGIGFASLRSNFPAPFSDYAGAQQSSPTYSGQFLTQHSTDFHTRTSSGNLYGSNQLIHHDPAAGGGDLELWGENWIQQSASGLREELAFASTYADPLTENYLCSMEYPPVYVSYLTDVNRDSSFLGWQPISDQALKITAKDYVTATNTVRSKRSCLTETQKPAKRVCISKADKPAGGSNSNSSSSGCTISSTANGNAGSKAPPKQGAPDPQTLAARHRRERISERLKILQNLVPNGSKVDLVTMLEKAINYVKFMQLQIQVLTADEYWPRKAAASEEKRDERETTSEPDVASTS